MGRTKGKVLRLGVDNDRSSRRCVDCGCRTTDYRCPECWGKIRGEEQRFDPSEFSGVSLDRSTTSMMREILCM